MKKNLLRSSVSMLFAGLALVACGGGDSEQSGQRTPFSVSPTEAGLQWAGETCDELKVADFLVMGGTPPYKIYSSYAPIVIPTPVGDVPFGITLSTAVLNGRNQQFSATVAGCFDDGRITIVDALGSSVTATVTTEAASAP